MAIILLFPSQFSWDAKLRGEHREREFLCSESELNGREWVDIGGSGFNWFVNSRGV